MILEKEQIQRYMRHIIMPEISGPGQKKLLDSAVLVCCEDLRHSAFMLYYLAAMGIGKITCLSKDTSNSKLLLESLIRLNPDVCVSFIDIINKDNNFDVIIIFDQTSQIDTVMSISQDTPYILTAVNADIGFIRTVLKHDDLTSAFVEYRDFGKNSKAILEDTLLNYPCSCLVGVLATIEAVKAILQIGKQNEQPLYIDLQDYSFTNNFREINDKFVYAADSFYSKLKAASVLIVGSGGLGSPVAYILAQMGIGKLGLVDFDTVDISNLNRQILHSTDKVGMSKVESAKSFLKELNPNIEVCTYQQKFSRENAESLIKDYDIIVDGLDNLSTRYLLNDTCFFLNKPLVEAGVLAFNGLATVILPDKGPCYRCTFPEVEDTSSIPSCSETGVLGAVPGIMGALQAVEVLKQLTGIGDTLLNKLIMIDALNAEFTKLDIYKEDSCPLCGSNPTIDALKDYSFVCSSRN